MNAVRNGNGTEQTPFRKINDAAKIAQPGDEVLVFPGTYREYVDPIYAGREDARITYRSVKPLGAVITGAEEIKTWTPYQRAMSGWHASPTDCSVLTIPTPHWFMVTGILQRQTNIPAAYI